MTHSLNYRSSSPTYSTSNRTFYDSVPANSQIFNNASTQGSFRISRLEQSDTLKVLAYDPVETGHMLGLYDVSLNQTLGPLWQSVGQIVLGTQHQGGCALISHNLAIVPCHIIEGFDVRGMRAVFGHARAETGVYGGSSYAVLGIVECDPSLDYAILSLDGAPGKTHGFLPIRKEGAASAPALLHYPLGKPQKISIHTFNQTYYHSYWLDTYHDTDYGSSGGAYISPSGTFIAMHLGSQRTAASLNLLRLALPIQRILEEKSAGILGRLLRGNLAQNSYSSVEIYWYYLYPYLRNFIDFEQFVRANCLTDGYHLRAPTANQPGIIIEPYQAKHTIKWPYQWQGARGNSILDLELDETITLADIIVNDISLFSTIPQQNSTPSIIRWIIDKKTLGKELFKKVNSYKEINVYAAFDTQKQSWEIHFYPQQ